MGSPTLNRISDHELNASGDVLFVRKFMFYFSDEDSQSDFVNIEYHNILSWIDRFSKMFSELLNLDPRFCDDLTNLVDSLGFPEMPLQAALVF